MYKIYNRH